MNLNWIYLFNIILILLYSFQNGQSEIADCLMEKYSLKNTLALGIIKNKLYQYTLNHDWAQYKLDLDNLNYEQVNLKSPPLNAQFNLTNGIAYPFTNAVGFQLNDNYLYKMILLMEPKILLQTLSVAVQINKQDGYSVFFYLKQTLLSILEVPIEPPNPSSITSVQLKEYDRIIPIWMWKRNMQYFRHYPKYNIVIQSNGLVLLVFNDIKSILSRSYLCWEDPFADNVIYLETSTTETCFKSGEFFKNIRLAFVLPNILYLVDIDYNQRSYELTFPIFTSGSSNYTIHNNSNNEFQCHFNDYNPFEHLYFFIFITFIVLSILFGLFVFYFLMKKKSKQDLNLKVKQKLIDKNTIKWRTSPLRSTATVKSSKYPFLF